MKKFLLCIFKNTKIVRRKYYASGIGTLLINLIVKNIFRVYQCDFILHFTSRINKPKNITIKKSENNTTVYTSLASSSGCYYQAINGIQIGFGTIWAPNVMFISANHDFLNIKKSVVGEPIIIGDFTWIGANSVFLPEVNIGNYCVVGAGSIVTKSFSDYSIIAGNPAKILAMRCRKCLAKINLEEYICSNCKPK
ncbi:MAG TPA: capsule biosynthesis protein CapJ [Prolixibacteraceae bacterium]|nr:capsule biosynthesis protein CapJ [Prolixibacteraceae bacterium]